MKQLITLLILLFTISGPFSQYSNGEVYSSNKGIAYGNDGSLNGWTKIDNDVSFGSNPPAIGNENVSFFASSEGIYVIVNSGTYKINLYALTGQLLSTGDLTPGRFFSPTRRGIYRSEEHTSELQS